MILSCFRGARSRPARASEIPSVLIVVWVRVAAVHGVWPRILPIPRADSSVFARNPATGLSAISSA